MSTFRNVVTAVAAVGVTAATVVALALAVPAQAAPTQPAAPSVVATDAAAVTTAQARIVQLAKLIEAGHSEPGWRGGRVPYSWGAGHGAAARPSLGTCVGYTGSIHPCPANRTVGVDCSGFTRWVYDLAFGRDVFGPGNTNDQVANGHMHRTSHPQPGDLVFYGSSTGNTHHVGIYIGNGKIIDAPHTGGYVQTDSAHFLSDLLGYYHYR